MDNQENIIPNRALNLEEFNRKYNNHDNGEIKEDDNADGLDFGVKNDDKDAANVKKVRKPLFKVDPSFMIENLKDLEKTPPLQALYKDFVIDADKNLRLKGRGYEL